MPPSACRSGCCWSLTSTTSLARAPGETARSVLLPRLADRAEVPLERATSAADGVSRGARMAGAPLAGVLVAVLGPTNVLFVNTATFAVSALLVWLAVADPTRAHGRSAGHPLRDLREGLAFLLQEPLIRAITLMVMLTNMLDAASTTVLLPVYARDVLGSSVGLGLMFGVFGAGALTGAVLYGAIGQRLPRRTVFIVAFLVVGAPRYVVLASRTGPAHGADRHGRRRARRGLAQPDPFRRGLRADPGAAARSSARRADRRCLCGHADRRDRCGLDGRGGRACAPSLVGVGVVYLLVTLSPLVFPAWRAMDDTRGTIQREEAPHRALSPDDQPLRA